VYGVVRFTSTMHLGAAAWRSEEVHHDSALDTLPEHQRIAYKAGHWDHAWCIRDVLRFPTLVAVGVGRLGLQPHSLCRSVPSCS
jgi:hypothetical protein